MIILSHRGYWKNASEKNSRVAFERSFSLDFGIETDIRDFNSELVISHDIADQHCMKLSELLDIREKYNNTLPLALNIKADGLQYKLNLLLEEYNIKNYFVFDMSMPETLQYLKHNIVFFTRESEYEKFPILYYEASGVWLDEFKEHWINEQTIKEHLNNNKQICIVSPELHKIEHRDRWQYYKKMEKTLMVKNLMICTDFPEEAKEFFCG